MDPQIDVYDITPEMAKECLSRNTHNRPLSSRQINLLARDMLAGKFLYTGDSIKFDRNNVLRDGQHRLHAIVQSGVTVRMTVVTGLDPETQDVMDTGRKRTAGNAFALAGIPNGNVLAAAARIALLFDAPIRGYGAAFTNSEILEYVEANPVGAAREPATCDTCGARCGTCSPETARSPEEELVAAEADLEAATDRYRTAIAATEGGAS
jgi:hypothetical protein